MKFVVIETPIEPESNMRVLYIGDSQSEIKSYLQAMKNLAKGQKRIYKNLISKKN